MKLFSRIFLKGLAVIVPIAGTFAIAAWLGSVFGSMGERFLGPFFPIGWDFPGIGILAGLAFVFGVGLLAHLWIFEKLFNAVGRALGRAPLIKAIYGSLKDLSDFVFPSDSTKKLGRSVLVKLESLGVSMVGFEMVEGLADHEVGEGLENASDKVIVYLPMSYQIGGYMAIVDRSDVTPLSLNTEEALKLTLTAGITGADNSKILESQNKRMGSET